ncbi:hypothetical protein GGF46_003161 [Coemansia sp. RSA 552]|nr:hypothetical protein GGF46_003161 [Coemansia sp. RSA 552]
MGTGKTCECLALVLITKRQMARPPIEGAAVSGVGTVTSPLITGLCGARVGKGPSHAVAEDTPRVPSLKTLAAQAALLSCVESLRVMHDDGLLSADAWGSLEPYPPYYWVNPVADGHRRRGMDSKRAECVAFKVYMSSSTIVVVPDNLVDQWVREKYKHIEDSGGLEVLKIDSSTETIPEPTQLIKYDMVLISVGRLSREYIPIDSKIGELWHSCRCYSRGLEHCRCDRRREDAAYRSPLLRVHWKRLIVDEGHIMSSRNTARVLMAAYLIADRRWVCTGTPTNNLVHATSEIAAPDVHVQVEGESDGLSGSVGSSPLPVAAGRRYRIGARESTSDFQQLGVLVAKFLRMDPFYRSSAAWRSVMVQPYKRGDPSARARLRALMQSIMVRSCPEDVGREIQLPPLHERTVMLRPTRLQALSYNIVVAFFHINAILTERVGRDYFFHPDNKRHLRQIVANLFLACFWFPISRKHLQDGISNGRGALELWERGEKPYSPEDVGLLRRSIAVLEHATEDAEWLFAVMADSATYRVRGLPHKLPTSTMFPLESSSGSSNVSLGQETGAGHMATATQLLDLASQVKGMLATANDRLPPLSTNLDPGEFEEVRDARIYSSTCNKIAYLVDSLGRHYRDEKCIVFTSTPGDVSLIDDALRLVHIPHLLYANSAMSQSQRLHNITTFSTSAMYNVIVMDVHLAAYGIDLSAASRVWFVSPIWQAARERQAIKRAHRLGQLRPVFVETLLTEGSIEEALWARRKEISSGNDGQVVARDVEEDGKMRSMLSNARFINGSNPGTLDSPAPILPSNIRYPRILRQKYEMWSAPESPTSSPKLPFAKTKHLALRISETTNLYST